MSTALYYIIGLMILGLIVVCVVKPSNAAKKFITGHGWLEGIINFASLVGIGYLAIYYFQPIMGSITDSLAIVTSSGHAFFVIVLIGGITAIGGICIRTYFFKDFLGGVSKNLLAVVDASLWALWTWAIMSLFRIPSAMSGFWALHLSYLAFALSLAQHLVSTWYDDRQKRWGILITYIVFSCLTWGAGMFIGSNISSNLFATTVGVWTLLSFNILLFTIHCILSQSRDNKISRTTLWVWGAILMAIYGMNLMDLTFFTTGTERRAVDAKNSTDYQRLELQQKIVLGDINKLENLRDQEAAGITSGATKMLKFYDRYCDEIIARTDELQQLERRKIALTNAMQNRINWFKKAEQGSGVIGEPVKAIWQMAFGKPTPKIDLSLPTTPIEVNKGEIKFGDPAPPNVITTFTSNKPFIVWEYTGNDLLPVRLPAGTTQRYYAWAGQPKVEGVEDGTKIEISHLPK